MPKKRTVEIVVPMTIDVDGAPNSYGPNNALALDYELNAHVGAKPSGKIVGYLTKNDDGRTPIVRVGRSLSRFLHFDHVLRGQEQRSP